MKIGLVLSGGGGKGAYELGVWMALKRLGIAPYIEVFSGTSIGAINAVLFAQDKLERAFEMWDEVSIDQLIPIGKLQLMKKGFGIAVGGKMIPINKKYVAQKMIEGAVSKEGAMGIINKYLFLDEVKKNKKICYATCTELPEIIPRYFKINDYEDEIGKQLIVASASLPHIYDCETILDKQYVDGGVVENTPIKPVYDEGCDIIIVVKLENKNPVNPKLYPGASIIEIMPKKPIGNLLTGTLNLDAQAKKFRIDRGYDDTLECIQPVMKLYEALQENKQLKEE